MKWGARWALTEVDVGEEAQEVADRAGLWVLWGGCEGGDEGVCKGLVDGGRQLDGRLVLRGTERRQR